MLGQNATRPRKEVRPPFFDAVVVSVDGTRARRDNTGMTQTIHLESDVYAVAESLARQEHCTVGAVVNQVLRRTLVGPVRSDSRPSERTPPHLTMDPETGFPLVKCSQPFTSEDVYRCEMDVS
jgi:hypothetical protein